MPRVPRTLISKSHNHPNQDIILTEIDCTFVFTIYRVESLSRTVTVDDLEASHVGSTATIIEDMYLLDLCIGLQLCLLPLIARLADNW